MSEDLCRGRGPSKSLSMILLFTVLLKIDAKRTEISPGVVSRCREHVTTIYPITKVAYTGTYCRKFSINSLRNFNLFKCLAMFCQHKNVGNLSFETSSRKKRSLSGSKTWGKRSSENKTPIRTRTARARLRPLRLGKRFQKKEAKRTKGPFHQILWESD